MLSNDSCALLSTFTREIWRRRIEDDDMIQREVHNADLSGHDRACVIQ